MKKYLKFAAPVVAALLVSACTTDKMMDKGAEMAKDAMMPFGGPTDTDYAANMWQALSAANLVGSGRVLTKAYTGQHPHGAILQNVESTLTVNGETGVVIVKSNYGGDGVSAEAVSQNPDKYLAAVTVMFQRADYDPDSNNWYWAKYLPDGTLDKNPKGMQLAGKVGNKEAGAGCLGCHQAAPGGDYVFTNNRYAN